MEEGILENIKRKKYNKKNNTKKKLVITKEEKVAKAVKLIKDKGVNIESNYNKNKKIK